MQEIKIRYTWKRKSDGNIYQTIVPIECFEGKNDTPFMGNELWDLLAKDLFTGIISTDKREIYESDIVKDQDTYMFVYYNSSMASFDVSYGTPSNPEDSEPLVDEDGECNYEWCGDIYNDLKLLDQ